MIKAVIFDMDGLMFDTEALAVKAWKYVGEKFEINIDDTAIAKIRGVDIFHRKETFEEIFGESIDFYGMQSALDAYMNEYVDEHGVPIKEGLEELLEYLKRRGLKIALATSTENKRAIYYLTNANVLHYFNKLLCGDMVEHGKPAPDIYLKAVASLKLNTEECLVLEDSPNGSLAAHRANCPVIMVEDLDKPDEDIKGIVLNVVKNLKEAKKIIEKL